MNLRNRSDRQRGFTLIELVVVIAILGVMAAMVVPAVTRPFRESQESAYKTELKLIQKLLDQYVVGTENPSFQGRVQFPIAGAAKGAGVFYPGDADTDAEIVVILGNPQAGTAGGTPVWKDNGDGVRSPAEEVLNDEDSTGAETGWRVATVVVGTITYYVDSRDYFVDFDLLVTSDSSDGLLRQPPESASQENCSVSSCNGSYTYYIDAQGNVRTLLSNFPQPETLGFQEGVFP